MESYQQSQIQDDIIQHILGKRKLYGHGINMVGNESVRERYLSTEFSEEAVIVYQS